MSHRSQSQRLPEGHRRMDYDANTGAVPGVQGGQYRPSPAPGGNETRSCPDFQDQRRPVVARPDLQTAPAPKSFQDFLPSTSIASPGGPKANHSPKSPMHHAPPPPTSFQDFLPNSYITSPTTAEGGHSPLARTPKTPTKPTAQAPPSPNIPPPSLPAVPVPVPDKSLPSTPRNRFAQIARNAVGSLRKKEQSKTPKVDPTAAALQWVESASTARSPPLDSGHNPRSQSVHHNHTHTENPWPSHKVQMSADAAYPASNGQYSPYNRQTKPKRNPIPKVVRFKEGQELIPTPAWTPPSSSESLLDNYYAEPGSGDDDDDDDDEDDPVNKAPSPKLGDFDWEHVERSEVDIDMRTNQTLALAAAKERRNRREGLRIIPPLTTAMLATTVS
ncbi:hypothetical protein V5O48_010622 [Marasmius crinis-equi]|uniref:Uncharacterized protein n=1 Tax=Marasmius crinis-equi TaxID=585013 RepID=A0ABR3F7V7_9AGAR